MVFHDPSCNRLTCKSKLEFWRYFGVRMFGTGRDGMRLHGQNGISVIDTEVLFCT